MEDSGVSPQEFYQWSLPIRDLGQQNGESAGKSESANSSADPAMAKPFPFLRLPAELRNKIYGYVLTDNREERGFKVPRSDGSKSHFHEQIDRVILVNDVARRMERRRINQRYADRPEQYRAKKGAGLSKKYHLLNKTGVIKSRLARNLYGSLSLRETSILAVCRQMHREARHVLYSENTFGVIVSLDETGRPFGSWFPSGTSAPRHQMEFLPQNDRAEISPNVRHVPIH